MLLPAAKRQKNKAHGASRGFTAKLSSAPAGRKIAARAILLLAFLPQFSLASFPADSVHSLAERVNRHYNSLQTLETQFTETFRGPGIDRTESGTLWLKRPGRMRWEYQQPRQKLFVTDGKTAWFYAPGDRQARRTPFRKLEDLRSPLAFLLGRTRLEKEFDHLTQVTNEPSVHSGNLALQGVPKGMNQRVTRVLLEVTPDGRIDRIVAEEVDGSMTEYRFQQSRENAVIEDSRFRFSPPAGVEVIESTVGD